MTPFRSRKGFGIVGGLGPLAGADIFLKLIRSTPAESDKEHFDVVFEQHPFPDGNAIADEHYNATSRKLHVFNIIKGLEHRQVDAVMLTCFISHTFFDELAPEVELPIVNIMEALRAHVGTEYPQVTRLGVLTSSYVMMQRLFERYFEADRYALVYPDQEIQRQCVMEAIYGPRGIKAGDLGDAPVELIQQACRNLVGRGAEIIIPGLTEIPVIIDGLCRGIDVPIVDSNEVYAKHAIFSQLRSGPKQFKVGIIGGVGPAATVDFMNKIVARTDAARDQDHVKLVVEHNPQIPDRTDNLMGEGMDPTISLYSACKKLESNDADVIAIPCNTAHAFVERIQRHLTIPILDMPFENRDRWALPRNRCSDRRLE